ncbi:hypothetical protein ASPACDRAFT_58383 [Aspergillus aculeatus ATCC 16872]|uniref:Glycoside hydrolase 131 catalytic N-terminal domain-containing protein n=1 Tax=Aspergillus aculeatus (strain ATCC 16872 / CBS 172.66 / WB 5094) TaxID=690307 RepID=A0A1L9X0J0_ASPA1|nr:uncharacterized protein ASPACDRAFT_58383 [Aspergillus aculeatus ATCC 16872]OJK02000.1 hypothetical protein ASPACDRAFT_58383 [Aspergillus aculeatus ATCC 16872]
MHLPTLALTVTLLLSPALSTPLLNFSAANGDPPSTLGILNLEEARDQEISANTNDLYIKLATDPHGVPALHYHRKQSYIRAEYHALANQIEEDKTYYIGYKFSLGVIEQSLMIFQFKSYATTTNSANIPLSLEFMSGQLHLQYQADSASEREPQWSRTVDTDTVYSVGLVIHTGQPGWVEFYFQGEQQTLGAAGATRLSANTWTGRTEPKFGAYRGEAVAVDTYVYRVQIGTEMGDIVEAAELDAVRSTATASASASAPAATGSCSWTGHCKGASCATEDDCSDELVCTGGKCAAA